MAATLNLSQLTELFHTRKWCIVKAVRRHFLPAVDMGNGNYEFDMQQTMNVFSNRATSPGMLFPYRPSTVKSTKELEA